MPNFIIVDEIDEELSHTALVEQYREWVSSGCKERMTSKHLAGLFYQLYKKRYAGYPQSSIALDLHHFNSLIHWLGDRRDLAPACVKVFFSPSLRSFLGVSPSVFSSHNILEKWHILERAQDIKPAGEQAEFTGSETFGVRYV